MTTSALEEPASKQLAGRRKALQWDQRTKQGAEIADALVAKMAAERNPLLLRRLMRRVFGAEEFGTLDYGGKDLSVDEFEGIQVGFLYRLGEKVLGVAHPPRSDFSFDAKEFVASPFISPASSYQSVPNAGVVRVSAVDLPNAVAPVVQTSPVIEADRSKPRKIELSEADENARLLRMPEVERLVGVSKTTVYRLVAEGKFPVPIRRGKTSSWVKREIIAYLEEIKLDRLGLIIDRSEESS